MGRKTSDYTPITAGTAATEGYFIFVDPTQPIDADKMQMLPLAEAVELFTALGTAETYPLGRNSINNPTFSSGGAGWSTTGVGVTYPGDGTASGNGAGDLRQNLRQFTAQDFKVGITVEVKNASTPSNFRLFVAGVAEEINANFSTDGTTDGWSTIYGTWDVHPDWIGKTIILMIGYTMGDSIKNPKLFYNGDVDTIQKEVKAYTDSEIARTKYFQPRFEGKRLIGIGDSFLHSGGILTRIAQNTGMTWLQAEQQNADLSIGTSSGGVPVRPIYGGGGYAADFSAYMRADNLAQHTPDVIWLHAGTVTDELQQPPADWDPEVDIWEPAYEGGNILWDDPEAPSYIAALKGTLKKITEQNPTARVYLTSTIFHNADLDELGETAWKAFMRKRDCHRLIANMYSVIFIDVMAESGVHLYNKTYYAPDGHTTADGAARIGDYMTTRL